MSRGDYLRDRGLSDDPVIQPSTPRVPLYHFDPKSGEIVVDPAEDGQAVSQPGLPDDYAARLVALEYGSRNGPDMDLIRTYHAFLTATEPPREQRTFTDE